MAAKSTSQPPVMMSFIALLRRALDKLARGRTKVGPKELLQTKAASTAASDSTLPAVPKEALTLPGQLAVLTAKASVSLAAKSYQEALDALTAATALCPTSSAEAPSADFLWSIAAMKVEALGGMGHPEDLAFSADLVLLEPQDPALRLIRVRALYQRGKLEDALKYAATLADTEDVRQLKERISRVNELRAQKDNVKLAKEAVQVLTDMLLAAKDNRLVQAQSYRKRALNRRITEDYTGALADCASLTALYEAHPADQGSAPLFRWQYLHTPVLTARIQLCIDNPKPALDILKEGQQGACTDEERKTLMDELKETWDPYAILGISPSASLAEVTSLYRRLSLIYHPDKGGNDAKMKEINGAYEAIKKTYGK
ncbi:hypothetical protein JCM10213_005733 [Rhodosporidiobolus nylandii]